MRNWIHVSVMMGMLWLGSAAALGAQEPPPPPAPEKSEPPAKFERDSSAAVIPYTLGGIAVLVVMTLVCMPARRE